MKYDAGEGKPIIRVPDPRPDGPEADDLQSGPGLHLHNLGSLVRRRRSLILAIAASGTLLAGLAAIMVPPSYTATAQIEVESKPPELDETAVDTQVTMLTSEAHLRRVRRTLSTRPDLQAELVESTTAPPTVIDQLRNWLIGVSTPLKDFIKSLLPAPDNPEDLDESAGTEVPSMAELKAALRVNQERRSRVVTVNYTDYSPKKAAALANQFVQLHIVNLTEKAQQEIERLLGWLDQRVVEVGAEMEQAQKALESYRVEHGANKTDADDVGYIAERKRQLAVAQLESARLRARLETIRDLQRRGADADAFAKVLDSPIIRDLRRQELELGQSEAARSKSPDGPQSTSQEAQDRGQELRTRIAQEIEREVKRAENETEIVRSQAQSLEQHLQLLQAATGEYPNEIAELRVLEHRADSATKLLDDLLRRRQETAEQHQLPPITARILAPAWKPVRPSSFNPLLFIPPALVAFSLLGTGIAAVLERLDRSLRSQRDVADALGIPCIGLVPNIPSHKRGRGEHYLVDEPYSSYGQAIRSVVVAALQLTAAHRKPKIILITSSVPGEGKTILAKSFAVCAAHLGRRALLVDLNLRTPGAVGDVEELPETNALKTFLNGHPDAGAIARVPDPGFDCLPARQIGLDPIALLASDQAMMAFHRLRESYDCVIIDGPPAFATAEAQLIASVADEVIFAVRWGKTRREVARNALQLLCGSRMPGHDTVAKIDAVLTRVNLKVHARYGHGDRGEFLLRYRRYYSRRPRKRSSRSQVGTPHEMGLSIQRWLNMVSGLLAAFWTLSRVTRQAPGSRSER